jgi:hypothetical protein
MEKRNLTDHSPAAMGRLARPHTTAIVLHRFAADADADSVTTIEEAIDFFTKNPAGIATVTLPGTWAEIKPTIDRWEREGVPAAYANRGFVPYHFLVDKQGNVARTLSLDMRGAHAGKHWNRVAVAVACLGNFELEIPSKEQLAGCSALVADILKVYPRAEILTHDECQRRDGIENVKRCPGRHFPAELVANNARLLLRNARA